MQQTPEQTPQPANLSTLISLLQGILGAINKTNVNGYGEPCITGTFGSVRYPRKSSTEPTHRGKITIVGMPDGNFDYTEFYIAGWERQSSTGNYFSYTITKANLQKQVANSVFAHKKQEEANTAAAHASAAHDNKPPF